DVLDEVWAERPALPQGTVFEHLPPFACRSRAQNLAEVRASMAGQGADWHWLSSLDDIAWLFNLRGDDVPYNPVFLAYALIGADSARLFVAPGKIKPDLQERLLADGVVLSPYDEAAGALSCLPVGQVLLLDIQRSAVGTHAAAALVDVVDGINPSQLLKTRKNTAEAGNVRPTMMKDGENL